VSKVCIVCDSTVDIPPAELQAMGVVMVPLSVLFGEESYLDWIELENAIFYERLKSSTVLPTTSQPSAGDFLAAYRAAAANGCTEIVSIHLTSALSGTVSSATLAAQDSPVPVRIVDTKKVSHAVALVLKAAIAARDAGGTADDVEAAAWKVVDGLRLFFVLDTLEYLVKGGRAGKAQGLAASLLNIKPVLEMNAEGTIEPFKKAKGLKKAMAEIAQHMAADAAARGPLVAIVIHAQAPQAAAELEDAIRATGAAIELLPTGLIGSVIGTYAGQGAVGVAYALAG